MKVIEYLRYSCDGQSQHSIERQQLITESWRIHNKAILVDSYIDKGQSAKTFDRPNIIALFAFIRKHYIEIDYIVVSDLSRFSREAGDAINMTKLPSPIRRRV